MNYQVFRERFSKFTCFSVEQVLAAFPDFNCGNYRQWILHGYIKRLRRGWYAFSDALHIPCVCDYFAGKIYSPSYLSCEYVMARTGLIPESVVQLTCVTTLKTASFKNEFGEFFYRSIKPELMFGYDVQVINGTLPVNVALPHKAFCDFLYLNHRYNTLEDMEGLRLDEDTLSELVSGGVLERTAERFRSSALMRRIGLARKAYAI